MERWRSEKITARKNMEEWKGKTKRTEKQIERHGNNKKWDQIKRDGRSD